MNGKEVAFRRARDGFAQWRANRKGKEPIPKELFRLAARAVEFSDVSTVAFELGLNHGRLVRGLKETRQSPSASLANTRPAVTTSEGFHFSRFDSPAAENLAVPHEAIDPKQILGCVHAQVHFQNGIVLSLQTLASVRVWCREAARQGGV